MSWSPDSSSIAFSTAGGSQVGLIDVAVGAAAAWALVGGAISTLEYSHDGQWLAVGLEAGDVDIVQASTATVVATLATSGTVAALSWHPEDTHLVVGGESPEVQALELLYGAR